MGASPPQQGGFCKQREVFERNGFETQGPTGNRASKWDNVVIGADGPDVEKDEKRSTAQGTSDPSAAL
jgi:hypothetical protein